MNVSPRDHRIDTPQSVHPQAERLSGLLNAQVKMAAVRAAPMHTFNHFEGKRLAVLAAAGDPMRIANAASSTSRVYVLGLRRGRCIARTVEGSARLSAGEFMIFHGSAEMEIVHQEPFEVIGVRLEEADLIRTMPEWRWCELAPMPCEGEARLLLDIGTWLIERGGTLEPGTVSATTDLMAALLGRALIARWQPASGSTGTRLDYQRSRVKQFCRRELNSPDLSVGRISEALGLSTAHLHRLFESEACTLMAWIQEERLQACKCAIEHDTAGQRSLTEIALSQGFKDFAHFSHAFKKHFGVGPRAFRQRGPASEDEGNPSPPLVTHTQVQETPAQVLKPPVS